MICREFVRKVEELMLSEPGQAADPQLLAHERECADCAELLQQRHALSRALQVLRNSTAGMEAPSVVEQNVLRAFRHSAAHVAVAEAKPLPHILTFRLSRFFEWGAYAAAAAALAISLGLGMWYLQHQHKATTNTAQQEVTTQPANPDVQPENTAQAAAQVQSTRPTQQTTGTATVRASQSSAPVPLMARAQQAQGYTPMMLCDPLSCSGDEQVVRMELPAPDGSPETQMADVIIGDDGLVRAIRIVQQ